MGAHAASSEMPMPVSIAGPGDHGPAIVEQTVQEFISVLEAVLATPEVQAKVTAANVDVRLTLRDRPGKPLHLMLSRDVPLVTGQAQLSRPDIILELASPDLRCFLHDGAELPLRILSGDIVFEGPVRKLLRVLPVIRAAAAQIAPPPGPRAP